MNRRPAEAYVHGDAGPIVVVPARVAAALDRRVGLKGLRADLGCGDPEVDAVLLALELAAGRWRSVIVPGRLARAASASGTAAGSADGTERDSAPAAPAALPSGAGTAPPLSSAQAAALLGITERAVTRAAARGSLTGRRVGRTWVLDRAAVDQYGATTSRRT